MIYDYVKESAEALEHCTDRGVMKHYLRGMTSILQIFPASPKRITEKDLPSFQDDAKALAGDWQRVGGYIRHAMEQEQHAQEQDAQTQAADSR